LPEKAIELRESYDGITPGWHMSKKHWNSVKLDGSVDDLLIRELIQHSYELVVSGLTKKLRDELAY
jgi:predicted DNA-binding protein (MmcQ/YjbR family)